MGAIIPSSNALRRSQNEEKILAAIISIAFVFETEISTSYASYYDNESEQMLDGNGSQFAQSAKEVLDLVNIERSKVGVSPLKLNEELMWASNIRAEEISRVFSHTRPDGSACSSLIKDGMYTVGENIAAGNSTPEATVEQWMNSPGHRANILNPDYTELGVGYFYDANSEHGHYWVQMFKRPMSVAIRKY